MSTHNKSRLFTDAEYDLMKSFDKGRRKDPTGLMAGRIRPKIKEMLDVWFPLKKNLRRYL